MKTGLSELNRHIADHYGIENRLDQLMEECGELIQAVSKYKRYVLHGEQTKRCSAEIARGKLIEEMADVEIMLEQVQYLASITEKDINSVKCFKLGRTLGDIENEQNKIPDRRR